MTLLMIISCLYLIGGLVTVGFSWYAVNYQQDIMAMLDAEVADYIRRASRLEMFLFYLFVDVAWPFYWPFYWLW